MAIDPEEEELLLQKERSRMGWNNPDGSPSRNYTFGGDEEWRETMGRAIQSAHDEEPLRGINGFCGLFYQRPQPRAQ